MPALTSLTSGCPIIHRSKTSLLFSSPLSLLILSSLLLTFILHSTATSSPESDHVPVNPQPNHVTRSRSGYNSSYSCNQHWHDIELFLPMGLQHDYRLGEWKDVFLHTFSLFWPMEVSNTKLLVLLDQEYSNHSYVKTIEDTLHQHHHLRNRSRIVYNDVPSIYYDDSGWKRQQYTMMYADNYTNAEYVGFVDTDTMFVTYVHSSDIFENGKPIINGKTGDPNQAIEREEPVWKEIMYTTYEIVGVKEPMKCMSYWPVVIKTKHIKAFREFLERKFKLPFYEVMRLHISKKWFGQFDMFCAYLYYHHQDEYTWYVHNISPGWDYKSDFVGMNDNASIYKPEMFGPKPRVAIHARHHVPEVSPSKTVEEFKSILQAGLCYSPPFPKTHPILKRYCHHYYSTLEHYQTHAFIELYRFEKYHFYRAYPWEVIQKRSFQRQQEIQHCRHTVSTKQLEDIFQIPAVVNGEIVYTEMTGPGLYLHENGIVQGFANWDAFVRKGFENKPRHKIPISVFCMLDRGPDIT